MVDLFGMLWQYPPSKSVTSFSPSSPALATTGVDLTLGLLVELVALVAGLVLLGYAAWLRWHS